MTPFVVGFLLVGPKTGPDVGKASPVGLFIVVLLLIVVFILVWSMNRHLKKIPASFDTPESASAGAPADETGGPQTGDSERPAHEPGG